MELFWYGKGLTWFVDVYLSNGFIWSWLWCCGTSRNIIKWCWYFKWYFSQDSVFLEVNVSTSTYEAQQELKKNFFDDRKEAMQSNLTQVIYETIQHTCLGHNQHFILCFRIWFVVANHFVSGGLEFYKRLKIYLLIFNKDDKNSVIFIDFSKDLQSFDCCM